MPKQHELFVTVLNFKLFSTRTAKEEGKFKTVLSVFSNEISERVTLLPSEVTGVNEISGVGDLTSFKEVSSLITSVFLLVFEEFIR
jgi:hypothetical protein